MSHCLVIGGTGMLKEVSRRLAYEFNTISVIGRNPRRFNALRRETIHLKGNMDPIRLDYTDSDLLKEEMKLSIERYGDISLVVSWIHSTAPDAGRMIAETVNESGKEFSFFDIHGSEYADPSKDVTTPDFAKLDHIKYRKIILGFMLEGENPRWLTDEEISNGVINAVSNDDEISIIGIVKPWDKRP